MLLNQLKKFIFHFFVAVSLLTSTSVFSQLAEGFIDDLIIDRSNPATFPNAGEVFMGTIFNDSGMQMFIWTKAGRVYVGDWNGSTYVIQSSPVLNIADEVGDWRDFGMISIALDPDFESNGKIYLYYVVDREHLIDFGTPNYDPNDNDYFDASIGRLTRYELNIGSSPLTTNYGTRTILIGQTKETGVALLHESHAGGAILFGTDGTLLVTTGDNASYSTVDAGSVGHTYYQQALSDGIIRPAENVGAFRSQMPTSLCGKVLRISPDDGSGIPSNPLYDSNDPNAPISKMYALGLRNPFRMSIEPGSGSTDPADGNPGIIHVADVGWGTWEDIHIFDKPGLNAGWPLFEGQTEHTGYQNTNTTNADENNELFKDNCLQPTSFDDDSILPENRRFVHNRPEVAWRHGNTPEARVPWFSGSTATDPLINDPGSPTTGINFNGNTTSGGVYIVGNGLGSSMNGKYIFSDYQRNWINVATFTDGSQNWISQIDQIAPSGYGDGIVHLFQNPLDGNVYYTNIFTGTVRRLSFDVPVWTVEPTDMVVECDGTPDPGGAYSAWISSFSGSVGCGSQTLSNNGSALSNLCGSTGSETVTFTLSDGCGNEIQKTATFTIIDTINPSWQIMPSDFIAECNGTENADFNTWLNSFSGTDACGTATVSHNGSGTISCGASENVTFTLTDACGNNISVDALYSVEDTLDLEEIETLKIVVSPNPAKDHLIISGLRSTALLTIFNIAGQELVTTSIENTQRIPINFKSGIYLLKISSDNGSVVKKIVVE
ncbi:MAG: T9SS type A sorting domain-containing protein [Flavobacteriaceae bacterium]|nr:T9SS type A sorting domain-containing protein [Flavobacteriaceae bacterium]